MRRARGGERRSFASGPAPGRGPARRALGPRRRPGGARRRRSRTAACAATSTRTRSPGSASALRAPRTPATSSSPSPSATRPSTGAASPTPAAAATARCSAATRSGRCSSSAAARTRPDEREQWTLRDVAPVVREHFGLMSRPDGAPGALHRDRAPRSCSLAPVAGRGRRRARRRGASRRPRRPRPPTATPKVVAERREHPDLSSSANIVDGHWEVAYFAGGDELALVLVDPRSGQVDESWTGYQVAWKMARGYSGAFGHKLNAPYVFLPLCAIFLIGLVDWRRRWRVANLDLLVLLGFGVSNFFFNRAEIGVSVPIVYPLLLYLFGRALWIGIRGRGRGAAPGLAGDLAADRRPLPGRLPRRPQRRRLGGDRRRLRQRRRRRPHRPRRTALRQLPRGRLAGRHLRPGQLLRLRPLRADLALVGLLGRPAGRPRRGGPLRPRHLRPALPARPPRPPRTGGPQARRDPRLRLGRLPLHGLRARVELQRRPRLGPPGRDPAGPRPPDRSVAPWRRWRS